MLHTNARKDLISTTPTSVSCVIPDASGLNDGPGLANLVINSVRGCMYVGIAAVVTVTLKWNDPAQGTNPQQVVLGTVTNSSGAAVQLPFAFSPIMDENGLAIPAPLSGVLILVSTTVAAAHSVANSSHIFVNYHYE